MKLQRILIDDISSAQIESDIGDAFFFLTLLVYDIADSKRNFLSFHGCLLNEFFAT